MTHSVNTAVLLAAGRGKRLRPYTDTTPKPLLLHNGRPMLNYVLDALVIAGINRICVVTHHLHEQVEAFLFKQYANSPDIDVQCVRQPHMSGTANALQCALQAQPDWFNHSFLLSATDYLVPKAFYHDLLSFHAAHGQGLSVSLKTLSAEQLSSRSSVRFSADGDVLEIVEKPAAGSAPSSQGANLVFVLPAAIRPFIDAVEPSGRGEYEVQSAINAHLKEFGGGRGLLQPTPAEWQLPLS